MTGDGSSGPESPSARGTRRAWSRGRIACAAAVLLALVLAAGWFLRDPDPRVILGRPAGMSAGVNGRDVLLALVVYERVPAGRPPYLPAWFPWPEPALPDRRFLVLVSDREGAVGYPRLLGPAPVMGSRQEVDRGPAPVPLLTREAAMIRMQEMLRGEEVRSRTAEPPHAVIEGR